MKRIANLLQIITGIVFVFSGFVKAVDPVGTQIKFEDYFIALGLEFFIPAALFFSFVLNAAELILGIMLILNIFRKQALWGSILLMAFFTPLTLWLAVDNPVSDCGCFGDAIILTNWQTFFKNIVILGFILFALLFGEKKQLRNFFSSSVLLLTVIVLSFGFEMYNYRHLPMFDFRPFKEGADIKAKIIIPKDAPREEYEIRLFYKNKKTGERKEFTMQNYPQDEKIWAFDTTINVLVKEGYEPPIHDFELTGLNGKNLTGQILNETGYLLIMISFDFDKADGKDLSKVGEYSEFCVKEDIPFYIFTSSSKNALEQFLSGYKFEGDLCTGDKTMLKTIVRSNPAWVLMKDGHIIKKWHFRDVPDIKKLKKELQTSSVLIF
ncbi:MAG: DoxX family protein [Bacteroidota bacterium]|nr:DoxX family protein [Bacteroidota bacterium]